MKRPTEYETFARWHKFTGLDNDGRALPPDVESIQYVRVVWKPETIIDFRCQKARACGHLFLWIPPGTHDRWPKPGKDTFQIRERDYKVLAVQQWPVDPPFQACYKVHLR